MLDIDPKLLAEAKEFAIQKHLKIFPLDTEKFVKVNELKEISNPLFFSRSNIPTEDGLLSNEIFGITKDDRTSIFAYIDLGAEFMHPLLYKTWVRLDANVKNVLAEADKYKYDESKGKFIQDPDGKTGLGYLKEVLMTKKLKKNESAKRNIKISFIEKYKEFLFIKKLIVVPAGYRDVDTAEEGNIGVGEINKLYDTIIRDANALKETEDYGLTLNGTIKFRIQENIMKVYNWFIFGRDPVTGEDAQASGLSRKLGLIRRAGMKKSFDWGSRLVICTQNLRKEELGDIDIGIDEIGVPIAALCANLFPYMLFNIRRWFENSMSDITSLMTVSREDKTTEMNYIQDWQMVYSDERIKKELDRFMHGMAQRFLPIEAPIDSTKIKKGVTKPYLYFKGVMVPDEKAAQDVLNGTTPPETYPLNQRPLTWCDLIYIAAVEAVEDKVALVTRFPVDTYWNQFPAKIKIISTIQTVPMIVDGKYYPRYPKIERKDLMTNSSNKFIDVALPNNTRLDSIGGDFDGDTISIKIPYSVEANDELLKSINDKKHYIGLGGVNRMTTIHEGLQSLYQLTMTLPDEENKLTDPEF